MSFDRVTRYDPNDQYDPAVSNPYVSRMEENSRGDYVTYEDYNDLLTQYNKLVRLIRELNDET